MADFQIVLPGEQGGLQLTGEADVVQCRLVFPDGLSVVGHLAPVLGVLGGEDAQQSGLARPVPADQAIDLAWFYCQVQIME